MLMNSTLVKDKVAVSLLVLALLLLTVNGVPAQPEPALTLVEVVVLAKVIPVLIIASSFTLMNNMIARTPVPKAMPDFPLFKLSEEVSEANVSLVLSIPRVLDLKLLSASSPLAQVLEVLLSLPSMLVASL